MRLKHREVAGAVVALTAAAVCIRLGVWQLHRLGERRARNVAIQVALKRPPLTVTAGLSADSARHRWLQARGVYDYGHEWLWRGRSFTGVPGVALITPLRLADGAAVLVDRGWVPSPDAYHVDRRAYRELDSADVLGIGMLAPRGRGDVDPAELRDSVPYPLLPVVLQVVPPLAGSDRPSPPHTVPERPPPPGLTRWPVPTLDNGPHLSYAIQWFSFALIILVGSVALIRKGTRVGA